MVESLLPPIIIPGVKLGLANIFVMLTLIYLSIQEAVILVVAKAILSGIFGGNVFSLVFSLSAGLISLLLTFLLLSFTKERLSILSVSSLSSAVNNIVQLLVYSLLLGSFNLICYAPYIVLIGAITGLLTGFVVFLVVKRDFKFFNLNLK